MKAIGFRVEPKQVHWAVVEAGGATKRLLAVGKFPAPVSYSEAQSLDWYRTQVRTLIDEHSPDKIAVRYQEPSAGKANSTSSHRRARIEGIILESAFSKGKEIITGPWATWSSLLKTKSAKQYLGRDEIRGIDQSAIADDYKQEAFLAALAAVGG